LQEKGGYHQGKRPRIVSSLYASKGEVPEANVQKGQVGGRDVIYFSFFDLLQDLLRSTVFYDIDNLCANREEQDHFKHFQPTTVADSGEIMSNEWASNRQDSIKEDGNFNPDQDFFLVLMLYGDKTGTNVNQWYPLEPWMLLHSCVAPADGKRRSEELATPWLSSIARLVCSIQTRLPFSQGKVAAVPQLDVSVA
jgi:hypothetical protein